VRTNKKRTSAATRSTARKKETKKEPGCFLFFPRGEKPFIVCVWTFSPATFKFWWEKKLLRESECVRRVVQIREKKILSFTHIRELDEMHIYILHKNCINTEIALYTYHTHARIFSFGHAHTHRHTL